MSAAATVVIHPSQFPDRIARDLTESLRSRQVNHKFLYDSVKQTRKWLELHQACSPSRNDPDCAATYERSFETAASRVHAPSVHLIGLGCGGGQKDTTLLRLLRQAVKEVCYTPVDVSAAMVLAARQTALAVVPEQNCFPLVCDLATADDLAGEFALPASCAAANMKPARLITFFGMIPNFEPEVILPKLAALVRTGDLLLFSANLSPGPDYEAGLERILPLYDNRLTREWLMMFLLDLGVERADGELRFGIESSPADATLKRIVANFQFTRPRTLDLDYGRFEFKPGERVRLFYSYRYTPALVSASLRRYGLEVSGEWLAKSGEEGVFLARQT